MSIEETFIKSDFVFLGVGNKRVNDFFYSFKIKELYKAPPDRSNEENIYVAAALKSAVLADGTFANSSAESTEFKDGVEYYIYGKLRENISAEKTEITSYLVTDDYCGHTKVSLGKHRSTYSLPNYDQWFMFSGRVISANHFYDQDNKINNTQSKIMFDELKIHNDAGIAGSFKVPQKIELSVLGCGEYFSVGKEYLVSPNDYEGIYVDTNNNEIIALFGSVPCIGKHMYILDEQDILRKLSGKKFDN